MCLASFEYDARGSRVSTRASFLSATASVLPVFDMGVSPSVRLAKAESAWRSSASRWVSLSVHFRSGHGVAKGKRRSVCRPVTDWTTEVLGSRSVSIVSRSASLQGWYSQMISEVVTPTQLMAGCRASDSAKELPPPAAGTIRRIHSACPNGLESSNAVHLITPSRTRAW